MKRFLSIFLVSISLTAYAQLAHDPILARQVAETSFVHAPLPLDEQRTFEHYGWQKPVLDSLALGNLRLEYLTYTGKRAVGSPSDPDYATYGHQSVRMKIEQDVKAYDRIAFSIYPECQGARVMNLTLTLGNGEPHLINVKPNEWNRCFLEIDTNRVSSFRELVFTATQNGRDRTMGDTVVYRIEDIQLQRTGQRTKVLGWEPAPEVVAYSTTGYAIGYPKTAIVNAAACPEGTPFSILDATSKRKVYGGKVHCQTTSIGSFGILDFSDLDREGRYVIRIGKDQTAAFRIGQGLWDDSCWRILNYIFCQRCGYPVPGVHGTCHTDLLAEHDGVSVSYNGGWHDAGDLSQQTLQTGDVTFALLEAYEKLKNRQPGLAARLREEAEWGLDFILRSRFGDGYHASSMGLLIWQDGRFGTLDDIHSVRVQNMAFDNFLFSAYEAYAALCLDHDPAMQQYLSKVAKEDFAFAMDKFRRDGFDLFVQPYEHTYGTSRSQFMATISWAASMLYRLTGEQTYADEAADAIRYTLSCQRTEQIGDGVCGFFYRDADRKSIVHNIHQSREQVYMQALTSLCVTQPQHVDCQEWQRSIRLYANYLKGLMPYTAPYGMVPSGVYHMDEYRDSAGFFALHLFPPADAMQRYTEQIRQGVQIDEEHYVKRFPVWFNIFNGNTAVHLSAGKAAAICGRFLADRELLEIGMEQLCWTVGKNPFAQSLIYGEGNNYPQLNSFSSGDITGALPVGIRTLGDGDAPYWPQTNNACYKEVWITSAGKWLSLVAELED